MGLVEVFLSEHPGLASGAGKVLDDVALTEAELFSDDDNLGAVGGVVGGVVDGVFLDGRGCDPAAAEAAGAPAGLVCVDVGFDRHGECDGQEHELGDSFAGAEDGRPAVVEEGEGQFEVAPVVGVDDADAVGDGDSACAEAAAEGEEADVPVGDGDLVGEFHDGDCPVVEGDVGGEAEIEAGGCGGGADGRPGCAGGDLDAELVHGWGFLPVLVYPVYPGSGGACQAQGDLSRPWVTPSGRVVTESMVSGSQARGLGDPARMASRCIALASGMGGSGRMCVMSQRAAIWVRVAPGSGSPRRPAMMSSRSRPPAAASASGLYPIHWRLRSRRQVPMGVGVESVTVGLLGDEEGGEAGGDAVGVVGVCAHVLGSLPDVGGGAAVLSDVLEEEGAGAVLGGAARLLGRGCGGVGGGCCVCCGGVALELLGRVDGAGEGVARALTADLGDGAAPQHLGGVEGPGASLTPESGLACLRLVPGGGEFVVGVVPPDECGGDRHALLADAKLVAGATDDGGH
uniref:Uncharacterized protein n=1 Tax=Siphoviridae sp. ctpyK9 TaxID=2825679 RepID=A0A8S5UU12_9CAUD|nr:MAG TPA: hypothetical protein [Siphoviridae sp. ctpyK9]